MIDPEFGFGFLKGKKIEDLLQKYGIRHFEDTQIPLLISTFNIFKFKTQVFKEGPISPICRAFASVPLLFHPVRLKRSFFWDGGVFDKAGVKGIQHLEQIKLTHYLHSGDWFCKLEEFLFYKKLMQNPFLFKSKPKFKLNFNNLELGPLITEQFYQESKNWLEEKIKI